MSLVTAEQKLRLLASADATLQEYLGVPPVFRWFHLQEEQGAIESGVCLRVRRVSAIYLYAQEGILATEQVRLQFDFLDKSPEAAANAMLAFNAFMGTVDLMSNAQFLSPPTTPRQSPNFLLNTRPGLEFRTERQIYVWTCDWRVWNDTTIVI
jgi:hypothetical protein